MRFAFYTLGCKVNQYETQAMEELLLTRGHTRVGFQEAADAYIINSCTVTAVSDKKSRQAVRQARKRAPEAIVALCGCFSQVSPQQAQALPVDLIGGSGDRLGFLQALEEVVEQREQQKRLDDALHRRHFETLPAGGLEGRTRAMLKVEDGCTNFCTYCIIPYARGPVRSLPLEQAQAEAKRLAAAGYREIVLTGIELSSYGRDLPGRPGTVELIEVVCQAAPGLRVRLGSLEPRTVTEDFCVRLAALPGLCPHFHLSLQSGCDETLRRMGRRYDTARYLQSVALLRRYFPKPGITTDLIVGFPGETEAEFAQTLSFLRRCAFSQLHIFPYSRRQGTRRRVCLARSRRRRRSIGPSRRRQWRKRCGKTGWTAGWARRSLSSLRRRRGAFGGGIPPSIWQCRWKHGGKTSTIRSGRCASPLWVRTGSWGPWMERKDYEQSRPAFY